MQTVAPETIRKIAELAGSGLPPDELEAAAFHFFGERSMTRRVLDWLPEAFGMVLASHMDSITLPSTFMARDISGTWVETPLSNDPIFVEAFKLAQHMYHHGPREVFSALALQSSCIDALNRALNSGESIVGAVISPPCMLGITVEACGGRA